MLLTSPASGFSVMADQCMCFSTNPSCFEIWWMSRSYKIHCIFARQNWGQESILFVVWLQQLLTGTATVNLGLHSRLILGGVMGLQEITATHLITSSSVSMASASGRTKQTIWGVGVSSIWGVS